MTNATRVLFAPIVFCLLMASPSWAVEAQDPTTGKSSPSQREKSSLIRNVIFKVWQAVGIEIGEGWSGKTSCACSSMAGNCPKTSDLCHAIGKTWAQLPPAEKKALCDGIRQEIDQGRGEGGSVNAADCEGNLKEPNWEQVMARLGQGFDEGS